MTFSGANKISGSFLIFSLHFPTQNTETITNTCDQPGTIRYYPLKFKKLSWFQIYELFLTTIFPVLVTKKNFSLENGFSLTKATNIIPKNEENLGQSVYKSSNFASFLQAVLLRTLALVFMFLICLRFPSRLPLLQFICN